MRGTKAALAAIVLAAAGLVVGISANGATAANVTTCTDFLAPGTYQRVVVPAGAACFSDGGVTIRSGLFVEPGATFVLGSEESPGDNGTISGGVHATNPANLQIHFMTINGGVVSHGGSGPFGGPFDITWNAIEDNHINGGVNISGYDGFWFGFIRNHVNGSVNAERQRPRRRGRERVRHQHDSRQPRLQRQLAGSPDRRLRGIAQQRHGREEGTVRRGLSARCCCERGSIRPLSQRSSTSRSVAVQVADRLAEHATRRA